MAHINPTSPLSGGDRPPNGDELSVYLRSVGLNDPALPGELRGLREPNSVTVQRTIDTYRPNPLDEQIIGRIIEILQRNRETIASSAPPVPSVQVALASRVRVTHEGPYQLTDSYAQTFPDDQISERVTAQVRRVYRENSDPRVRARAAGILNWFIRHFDLRSQGFQVIARMERDRGNTPTVGEYLDLVAQVLQELNPRPDFDLERFGPRERELDGATMAAISYAVCEEITIPNGLMAVRFGWDDGASKLALVDYSQSAIVTSPAGRNIPTFYGIPPMGETFGTITTKSNYLLIPDDYAIDCHNFGQGATGNFVAYKANNIPRKEFNFQNNPKNLTVYLGLHYARIILASGMVPGEQKLKEDIFEVLSMSDSQAFTEANLGRRMNEGNEGDHVSLARYTVKDSSFLKRKLESIDDIGQKKRYALALEAVRAKLVAITKTDSPSRLLLFADAIMTLAYAPEAPELASEPPHLILAREEFARLIGPKLFHTLQVGEDESIDKRRWFVWTDKTLRGSSNAEDATKIDQFDRRLPDITREILAEHFVDFDSAQPAWKDVSVNWRMVA